ncbi:GlxA family transcriptional regulator [Rhodoferax sp. AJA081-3]|uniref:GlxA family transcriptional regulator n=1 Tax=Rhodoferax sp. AJA081-3 TaxID=2752316 RepID=UPI001AE06A8F|nr:GlxA family transcriptional regulator [Rhodoferax sp. AJA081-3]QTN26706.1 GlxA family transcriptional regulator [Rhodoferax sp. AJA081-3]
MAKADVIRRTDAEEIGAQLVGRLDTAKAKTTPKASGVELRIGIFLWPRFPLLSLAGLCDALRHAADLGDQSRQVRCTWTVLSATGKAVASSCGVEVPATSAAASDGNFDYVAVIGGLLPSMKTADPVGLQFLKAATKMKVPLIGICTGSFALAKHGFMDGRMACVHPFHVTDWQETFPDLAFTTNCDYIIDGDRITCAGGISIIELATELIRMHCGPDRAAKVVHQMTVSQKSSISHMARRRALGYASADNDKLRQAIVLMEKNITTPLEISVIAKIVKASSRQLERVFLAETNTPPSEFYRNSRLKYGRWMLTSTDSPVSTIAYECGFADASHFIRHFQQLYGVTPGRLRKALQSKEA